MSEYSKLVDEFFIRYKDPQIDPLTIGFSGIDPPLKVLASEIDHEKLNHLLGGDENGHYHLTEEEWKFVLDLIKDMWTEFDGGFASTTEDEYNENEEYWLDGRFASSELTEEVDGGEAV